jgi:hypothetical protein
LRILPAERGDPLRASKTRRRRASPRCSRKSSTIAGSMSILRTAFSHRDDVGVPRRVERQQGARRMEGRAIQPIQSAAGMA